MTLIQRASQAKLLSVEPEQQPIFTASPKPPMHSSVAIHRIVYSMVGEFSIIILGDF